jgi:hypothetical protein
MELDRILEVMKILVLERVLEFKQHTPHFLVMESRENRAPVDGDAYGEVKMSKLIRVRQTI